MPESDIRKGLVGVVADTTAVSKVMEETKASPIAAIRCRTSPSTAASRKWPTCSGTATCPTRPSSPPSARRKRRRGRSPPALHQVIAAFPHGGHPMDAIRTGVSFMGMEDPETADNSEAATRRKAMRLLAKIPTAIAALHRAARGEAPIAPDPTLGLAANFFHLCFGRVPAPEVVKAFDVCLILYAEHDYNASTFTARVVTSTRADLHAAVTAAIGALKGPLHGGANEAVMDMLNEIGTPDRAATGWRAGSSIAR